MPLVKIDHLTKYYGDQLVLNDISWQISANDRIGLVGNNGSGKTTLFKIISGEISEYRGTVSRAKKIRIGHLHQEPEFESHMKLREAVRISAFRHIQELEEQIEYLTEMMKEDNSEDILEQYASVLERYEGVGGYDYEHKIDIVLGGMGFKPGDFDLPVSALSGGQKGRAALAKLLLEEPDLLLLDEPTNHLDLEGTEWLEYFLTTEYHGAIVVVSHDRYFLDKVVSKIAELRNNKLYEYKGNYTKFVFLKERELLVQQRQYELQQEEIERDLDFIRRYHAGQRSREARGRMKKLERMELIEKPQLDEKKIKISFEVDVRGGDDVLQLRDVSKTYNGKTLFKGVNLDLKRQDSLGIIGPNGVGKTTLLRIITGQEAPTTGTVRIGYNIKIGYFDQQLSGLNPNNTILDEVWQLMPKATQQEVRTYLGRYLFSGDDVFKLIKDLSGGEQSRVALAKLLLLNANFLILDEPTNHLDISSKEMLESALAEFPATLIVVSHDRYFLDKIVTKILFMERDKVWLWEGNYTEYQQYIIEKRAEEARRAAEERKRMVEERRKLELEKKKKEAQQSKEKKKKKKKQPPKRWVGI